jgi:hypothetical protein
LSFIIKDSKVTKWFILRNNFEWLIGKRSLYEKNETPSIYVIARGVIDHFILKGFYSDAAISSFGNGLEW